MPAAPRYAAFLRAYGPDLYRADHTASEILHLAATDENVHRWMRLQALACALRHGVYADSSLSAGVPPRSVSRDLARELSCSPRAAEHRMSRVLRAYREGGLCAVLHQWTQHIPRDELRRFAEPFGIEV